MWIRIKDSRHFQLAIYTVFDEESDFQVKIEQFRRPEAKKWKNKTRNIKKIEGLDVLSYDFLSYVSTVISS